VAAIVQHSQTLTGLASGTTYYDEACATNAVNETAPVCGALESFTTTGTAAAPPPTTSSTGSSGSSGASGSTGSTGPQTSSTVSVGHTTLTGSAVSIPVTCQGTSSCLVTASLSVEETLNGHTVVAVTAQATGQKKVKRTKKTVVVGSNRVTVGAGRRTTVKVSLNAAGKRLETKHPRLKTKLTVSLAGKRSATATVTFHRPTTKRKTAG
jgi:hypothetical protein